jgi:hypothetical protein
MCKFLSNSEVYSRELLDFIWQNTDYPDDLEKNYKSYHECFIWKGLIDNNGRPIVTINEYTMPVKILVYDSYIQQSDKYKFMLSKCKNELCINPMHLYESQYYTELTISRQIDRTEFDTDFEFNKRIKQKVIVDSLQNAIYLNILNISDICRRLDIYDSVLIDLINNYDQNFLCNNFSKKELYILKHKKLPVDYAPGTSKNIEFISNISNICFDCLRKFYQPSGNKNLCVSCFKHRMYMFSKQNYLRQSVFFNIDQNNYLNFRYEKFRKSYIEERILKLYYLNGFAFINNKKLCIAFLNSKKNEYKVIKSYDFTDHSIIKLIDTNIRPNEVLSINIKFKHGRIIDILPIEKFLKRFLEKRIRNGKLNDILMSLRKKFLTNEIDKWNDRLDRYFNSYLKANDKDENIHRYPFDQL